MKDLQIHDGSGIGKQGIYLSGFGRIGSPDFWAIFYDFETDNWYIPCMLLICSFPFKKLLLEFFELLY